METYTSLRTKFIESLTFAQKLLSAEYTYEEKPISVEALAAILCSEQEEFNQTYKFRFMLGIYKIDFDIPIQSQSYELMMTVWTGTYMELHFAEQVYPSGSYGQKAMSLSVLETMLEGLGTKPNLLMANPAYPSLIGLLVDKISKQQGKEMSLILNRSKAIQRLVNQGKKTDLRRILRTEYSEHKDILIPEARYAFRLLLLQLLKQCDQKIAA